MSQPYRNPYYDAPEESAQANFRQQHVKYQPLNSQQLYRNPQAQIQYPHLHSGLNQHRQAHSNRPQPIDLPPAVKHPRSSNPISNFINSSFNNDYCSFCHDTTPSYAHYRIGCFNYVMCLFLFFFTLCCFWVAFVVNQWKDAEFRCQACNSVKYVRKGNCQ